MPFQCPSCSAPRLEINERIEIAADAWWDEIALQVLDCAACGFAGLAVYEESRRGSLDSEVINHFGYACAAADVHRIRELIRECPHPSDRSCTCPAHDVLGQTVDGRWSGPRTMTAARSFSLQFINA